MMKKIAFLLISVLFFSACEDVESDINKYFPSVRTVSAELQSDGSVIVTGEIQSDGSSSVYYIGACMNSTGNPKIHENQLQATELIGNQFTVTYPWNSFDSDSAYFFRAWAANENGTGTGEAIVIDTITPTPVVPPCSPVNEKINFGLGTGVTSVYSTDTLIGFNYWEIHGSTSPQTNFIMMFRNRPTTHVYTITENSSNLGVNEVYMSFYLGGNGYILSAGSQVYVTKTNSNHWDITVCSAPWDFNSSTIFYMTGRFTAPY